MKMFTTISFALHLLLICQSSHGLAKSIYAEIESNLRADLLEPNKEYSITIPYLAQNLPTDYDSLRVELLGDSQPIGNCWLKVFIYDDDKILQSVNLNIQIALYQEVLVARESVKRDEPLGNDLVTIARREVTSLADPPLVDIDELEDMRAARAIPQGKILTRSMITPEIVIKRGDVVTIAYQKGNLKMTATGEAKQAGSRGDLIKVRNINSNKIITAEVQDEQSVKVLR